MLDSGGHSFGLQPLDVRGADHGCQLGILAEAFEMPAAVRGSVQVDGGGQQDVDTLPARLACEQSAQSLDTDRIPARGQGGRGGHVGRWASLVPGLTTNPRRPVRGDKPPQADLGYRMQRPDVGSCHQLDLLLEAQLGQPAGDFRFMINCGGLGHGASSQPSRRR